MDQFIHHHGSNLSTVAYEQQDPSLLYQVPDPGIETFESIRQSLPWHRRFGQFSTISGDMDAVRVVRDHPLNW